jgi:hypothetical protein
MTTHELKEDKILDCKGTYMYLLIITVFLLSNPAVKGADAFYFDSLDKCLEARQMLDEAPMKEPDVYGKKLSECIPLTQEKENE